jgi:hypothetical protein
MESTGIDRIKELIAQWRARGAGAGNNQQAHLTLEAIESVLNATPPPPPDDTIILPPG